MLPVLADFGPEIVINSAGQDNHYSDPLAHMRVSAQGYARLNELLAPDLAVLEGGYSIQSALPYVNLGIILAMADSNYTHVQEPDLDPETLRQSPEQWAVIRQVVDRLGTIWEEAEMVSARMYPHLKDSHTRQKQIFYDTDGIYESQSETVRVCDACPGWLRIDSRASGGGIGRRRVWAISIPWGACARCADEARTQYQSTMRNPSAPYDYIYLQDCLADEYRRYDGAAQRERTV